jgi:Acyl-CoA dehydrogenase N terminal
MSDYIAPLRDMRFVLNELGGLQSSTRLPPYAEITPELAEAVLGGHCTHVASYGRARTYSFLPNMC